MRRLTENRLRNIIAEAVRNAINENEEVDDFERICEETFSQMSGSEVYHFLRNYNLITDIEKIGQYIQHFIGNNKPGSWGERRKVWEKH